MQVELILPSQRGVAPTELVELAVAADRSTLHGVACPELAGVEAFSLLAAAATATERVRLSTSIVAVPSRGPALFAMAAQTVQHLSSGRFALGIGAGSPMVAGFHGKGYEKPFKELTATVRAIRAVVDGQRLEDAGGFRLTALDPLPLPIHVAAIGDASLRFAGREADGVVLSLLAGSDSVAYGAGVVRDAAREAGREDPVEVIAIQYAYSGDDPELAELAFRREITPYFSVPGYRSVALQLADEDEVERVAEAWLSGGRDLAAKLVPQSAVDALFVAGPLDVFKGRLDQLAAAGADTVRVVPITTKTGSSVDAWSILDQLGSL